MDEIKVTDGELIQAVIRLLKQQRQKELSITEQDQIDSKIMALRWVLCEVSDQELLERSC